MIIQRQFRAVLCAAIVSALSACTSNGDSPASPDLAILDLCDRTVSIVNVPGSVPANTSGHESTWRITNISPSANTAQVTCSGTGSITCTSAPFSLTLAAGASANVNIVFSAGAAGVPSKLYVSSCGGTNNKRIFVI